MGFDIPFAEIPGPPPGRLVPARAAL